jgi:hypothetical protein
MRAPNPTLEPPSEIEGEHAKTLVNQSGE